MKTKNILTLAALVATPALLAFERPLASIRFAPAAGATVTKRITTVTEMTLDEMDMLMNGQDTGGMMPQMDMDMTIEQNLVIADTYLESDGGRPVKLSRNFKELGQENAIEMTMEVMGETQDNSTDMPATSELEGTTVLFTWDGDGDYDKAFAEENADEDEDLLAGLVEDMDLRFLLPDGDVSEGDEWDLEMSKLPDLFAPGGDLAWDVEMDGMSGGMPGMGGNTEMMGNLRQMMGDMLEGEAKARFVGVEEGMAVIELTIKIDAAQDMTEFMEAAMAESPAPMMPDIERMDAEVEIDTRGKLLWNMNGNHLGGLTLEGEINVAMDMEMSMDTGQAPITIEVSMAMSGNMEMNIETE